MAKIRDWSRRWASIACVGAVILMAGACEPGDDDRPGADNLLTGSNGGGDSNQETPNQETVNQHNQPVDPCEGVVCDDEFTCSDGVCVPSADEGYWCDEPYEIGELQDNDRITVTADASGQPSTVNSSCSNVEGGNGIIRFSVAEPMDVEIVLADALVDTVIEIREDLCRSSEAVRQDWGTNGCQPIVPRASGYILDAEPEKDYYLIVEARDASNPGEVTLELSASALVCAPKGSWRCDPEDDDVMIQCWNGQEERSHRCGTGCSDGQCRANTCEHALEVTSPVTFAGEMGPHFTNDFNFLPHPACSSESETSTEGPRTIGQDMVFYFPSLFAGQRVIIDTTGGPTANYFGVVTECDPDNIQCIHGDNFQQVMEWEVPEDGDYYIIVNQDPATGLGSTALYEYAIDIID